MKKSDYAKSAVTFSAILTFIAAIIAASIIVLFIVRLSTKDYTSTNLSQIKVELRPKVWDFGKMKNIDDRTSYVYGQSGELIILNTPLPLFMFIHLYDVCYFVFILIVMNLFRKFFISLESNKIFTPENIKILKTISYLILYAPIVNSIILGWGLNYLLKSIEFKNNMIASWSFSIKDYLILLFMGTMLFAFTKILEQGFIFKQENDLTV